MLRDGPEIGIRYSAHFLFRGYAAVIAALTRASTSARISSRWACVSASNWSPGLLAGGAPSYQYMFGQLFPYAIRDVYGTRVVPENLGNIEPEPFYIYPTRFPADIINAAEKNLVVRDGTAGFYFHPFFDLQYLRDTVQGIRALGYTFVSPNDL